MTKISVAATLATRNIDHHGDDMFANLGCIYPAVVLLEVCERTEPADDEGERKVKLKIVGAEIPLTDATRDQLEQQLRDMYERRTGVGSLFDKKNAGR